jgi:hypothetical protein
MAAEKIEDKKNKISAITSWSSGAVVAWALAETIDENTLQRFRWVELMYMIDLILGPLAAAALLFALVSAAAFGDWPMAVGAGAVLPASHLIPIACPKPIWQTLAPIVFLNQCYHHSRLMIKVKKRRPERIKKKILVSCPRLWSPMRHYFTQALRDFSGQFDFGPFNAQLRNRYFLRSKIHLHVSFISIEKILIFPYRL